MVNLPNLITFVRILMIPVFVILYYLPFSGAHLSAAVIFALAAITDWLDGYLARSLQSMTHLGAFLDPVADKMMVCIALVMIVAEPHLKIGAAFILTIPAAVIVGREVVVSALREWMAEIGHRAQVKVSFLGKIKTTIQMLALIVFIASGKNTSIFVIFLGYTLMYLAAFLTLRSMLLYLKAAWPDFMKAC